MSTLLHRQAIVDALDAAIAGWPAMYRPRDVIPHAGRVTLEDLQHIASRKNTLMVSCLRTSDVRREPSFGNHLSVLARMAVFVGTCDTRKAKRDAMALVVTDLVTHLVYGNVFGSEFALDPERINSDNRYSVTIDKTGANLWAVTWDQRIAILPTEEEALDNLVSIFSELDSADPAKFESEITELDQPV